MILENWKEFNREIGKLMARSWQDPNYRQSFINNPRKTLEEAGLFIPNDIDIQVDTLSYRWRIEPTLDGRGVVYTIGLPVQPAGLTEKQIQGITEQEALSNDLVFAFGGCIPGTACF